MPDDLEEIRRKRLSRLQATSQQSSSTKPFLASSSSANINTSVPSVPPPPPPNNNNNNDNTTNAQQGETTNIESRLNKRPVSAGASIASKPTTAKVIKPKNVSASHSLSRSSSEPVNKTCFQLLCEIFNVSNDPQDHDKYRPEALSNVSDNTDNFILVGTQTAEIVLIEILSCHHKEPLSYLLSSWVRASQNIRELRMETKVDQPLIDFVCECEKLILNFYATCIKNQTSFNSSVTVVPVFSPIQNVISHDLNLLKLFLERLSVHFETQKDLEAIIWPIAISLSRNIRSKSVQTDFSTWLNYFFMLCITPQLCNCITTCPKFLPLNLKASSIDESTLLGPLLNLSPLDPKTSFELFKDTDPRWYMGNHPAVSGTNLAIENLQGTLFNIFDKLIRASVSSRERCLDFFAAVINSNHKRRALQVDRNLCVPDGILLNIISILNRLCDPFTSVGNSKIDRVDYTYFQKSQRLDIKEETKIDAASDESNAFYENNVIKDDLNFISHMFFLNLAAHYYGLDPFFQTIEKLDREITEIEQFLQWLYEKLNKGPSSFEAVLAERQLKQLTNKLEAKKTHKIAYEVVLWNRDAQLRSTTFLSFASRWLIRTIDIKHQHPNEVINLPIDTNTPKFFKFWPEFMIESINDYFLKIKRFTPVQLNSPVLQDLMYFSITLLTQRKWIHNPYLKAKIIEMLFYNVVSNKNQAIHSAESITDFLNVDPFAEKHLMRALLHLYIEVEITGASSQFYDKFNIRFHISHIFKAIWHNRKYQQQLERESQVDIEFFVHFVQLLLNDTTYLLDEALAKMQEIHGLEKDEPQNEPNDLQTDRIREHQRNLQSAERMAISYNQLSSENISLLSVFTRTTPKPFVTDEIVDRLAAMLNYELTALVGPKCTNLKVKDPQKYQFDAKTVLSKLLETFLNLRSYDKFIVGLARDERSFNEEIYVRAIAILRKHNIRSPEDIDNFAALLPKVITEREKMKQMEIDLGDVPEEFLDPILFSIMKDPVTLPGSQVNIDRSTIKSHLLSDPTDPFNRSPLKFEDVIPNDELRNKIQDFLKNHR